MSVFFLKKWPVLKLALRGIGVAFYGALFWALFYQLIFDKFPAGTFSRGKNSAKNYATIFATQINVSISLPDMNQQHRSLGTLRT